MRKLFLAFLSACAGLNNSFLAIWSMQKQKILQLLRMQRYKQESLRDWDQELHSQPHGLLHHTMLVHTV